MFDLPHVASCAFLTPLMIARPKLETILGVLGSRLVGNALSPIEPVADPPPRTSFTVERIAVVSVIGTLVSRSGYVDAASGLSSYAEIGEAIAGAMADPTVRGVVLDVDSAGGEVGSLFDVIEQIGAIKTATAKPLWAVANESALSAAYAIASAADRVYVTRTGEIGSVGVVAVHIDESGADAKAGLSWTFVFAGERIDLSGLNEIGRTVIVVVETVISLAVLHAGVSIVTVFIAVWVMQATTQGAGLGSRRARLLLAQRVSIGCLAVALAFNAATPFITPDPRWLSDVPVVFAIMMLLIIIGLLHRIQSEPHGGG